MSLRDPHPPRRRRCTFPFRAALLVVIGLPLCCRAGITVSTLSLERQAQPGEVYQGTLTLTNTDDTPRDARLYQTDYLCFSDGSNQYGEPGKLARSNAGWIVFSPHSVTVPPHQSSTVMLEVRVPPDTTLSGTYWSLLMVEQVDPVEDVPESSDKAMVRQVFRYGVQCITHVGGGAEVLRFTRTQLAQNNDGRPELQVDVQNSGDRWAVPSAWLELYDAQGRNIRRFDGEKKRIFPGTSVRFRIGLGDVPPGRYKALVVLDTGEQNVLGARYDLEL